MSATPSRNRHAYPTLTPLWWGECRIRFALGSLTTPQGGELTERAAAISEKGAASAAGALIAKAATRATPALASRAPSIAATPIVAASIARASLWAPPTTWIRTRGLRATNAAAPSGETQRAGARRATRIAMARTERAAAAFSVVTASQIGSQASG